MRAATPSPLSVGKVNAVNLPIEPTRGSVVTIDGEKWKHCIVGGVDGWYPLAEQTFGNDAQWWALPEIGDVVIWIDRGRLTPESLGHIVHDYKFGDRPFAIRGEGEQG
jgi:hypothetical protein